jgi:hypothetical protein
MILAKVVSLARWQYGSCLLRDEQEGRRRVQGIADRSAGACDHERVELIFRYLLEPREPHPQSHVPVKTKLPIVLRDKRVELCRRGRVVGELLHERPVHVQPTPLARREVEEGRDTLRYLRRHPIDRRGSNRFAELPEPDGAVSASDFLVLEDRVDIGRWVAVSHEQVHDMVRVHADIIAESAAALHSALLTEGASWR